ncbi:unnamed protein product [Dimorphilus gyrociliatus]|uniref:Uncharacterized protein n=1 Tax=Dimorphilus gyrociliatus TaxID=2664684 RepID=A0A7I8VVP1_9ANNE|nr:unnamed protein product [Dimorphilus gyrociliatus]
MRFRGIGMDLTASTWLINKLELNEKKIQAREPRAQEHLYSVAAELTHQQSNHRGSTEINSRVREVKNIWRTLKELVKARLLEDALESHQLLSRC